MGEQVAAGYIWGCSSVGRAPALQAGGHEFEAHHLQVSNEPCQDGSREQIVLAQICEADYGLIGRMPVIVSRRI